MAAGEQRGRPAPSPDEVTAAALAALGPGEAGWLVGGCLRDELLGIPVRDVDIAVDGAVEPFARSLADRLGGAVFASSEEHGTWRVMLGDVHIDAAPLRGAASAGSSASREARLAADLAGRDFTVNALARPLDGGELVDPLGGLDDLAARRLRLCAPSALDDDPLRVLRLFRLSRAFDLLPEADAVGAARRAAPGLAGVSGERVRDELSATLAGTDAAAAFRDLAVVDALGVVLPEIEALRGVGQNPYHHLDVFGHTLEALTYVPGVVEQLGGARFLTPPETAGLPDVPPLVPLSWAVLLHDIGKPAVRTVTDEGRTIFWHHDAMGRDLIAEVAERLRLSSRFAAYLGTLVRQHLRLGFLVREQPLTRRALARYRRDVSPWVFESVVVSLCDRLATRGEKTSLPSMARHYRLARVVWSGVTKSPVRRLLSGDEVMAELGIASGPVVGEALDALEEEVEAGEVKTPEEARDFLRSWWAQLQMQAGEDAANGADAGKPTAAGGNA